MRLSLAVARTLLSLAVASTALAHPSAPAPSLVQRATVCNGHAELCSRTYGNVTFVGAHDSYAVGVNNAATNQDYNVTQQLKDGIRMLQMQAHNQNGVIHLCHTSCALFDGGSLQDYLTTVKTWLDANPNEVLSLLIVNSDDLAASAYDTVFKAVGLDTVSFAPATSPLTTFGWPTLGSMIDSNKRLVTFLDNGADPSIPYLIDEFTNIWESAFDVVGTFDCAVNRTKGDSTTQMYLINHFLDMLILGQPAPDVALANITNAASGAGSLGEQVDLCISTYDRPPNFMLVDFYEYGGGSVFQVAATLNGVAYTPTTPIATPIPTTSSGSSSSSGGTSSSSGTSLLMDAREHIAAFLIIVAGVTLAPILML